MRPRTVDMNEAKIQALLMRYAMEERSHNIAIPNVTMVYSWEADLISVTESWLVHEFEIKISKSDYLADRKKLEKHEALFEQWRRPGKGEAEDESDEPPTKTLPSLFPGISFRVRREVPNYFWYVTWGFEVTDLPAYAGWLAIEPDAKRSPIRLKSDAPRLHGRKLRESSREKLARWLSFKLKNMYQIQYLDTPGDAHVS